MTFGTPSKMQMKNKYILLTLVVVMFGLSNDGAAYTEPMYGNKPITEEQKKVNDKFVADIIKKKGSKQEAFEQSIKLAWHYFYESNDPETAMRRFNQAWLIDPNDAEVFYGFGFLASVRGDGDKAIEFYKQALEINPNHPMSLANMARSYKDQAYKLYLTKQKNEPEREVKGLLEKALILYEKAIKAVTTDSPVRLTSLESDRGYIYYQWSVAVEFDGQYEEVWKKIQLCRKNGGNGFIEKGFINELTRFMLEPKN